MTDVNKVIFLDIDGPMIPAKACYLPNQTKLLSLFDPVATSLLLKIIEKSGAKIVISSVRGAHGLKDNQLLLAKNGISPTLLHDDWITVRHLSSDRSTQIRQWLDNHPETTHYVVIDDEHLNHALVPCRVQCSTYEGFSYRNFVECMTYLIDDYKRLNAPDGDLVTWLRRSEIRRTVKEGDPEYDDVYKFEATFLVEKE